MVARFYDACGATGTPRKCHLCRLHISFQRLMVPFRVEGHDIVLVYGAIYVGMHTHTRTHTHTHIHTGAMVVPVSWTSERTNGLSSGWSQRKSSSILLSLHTSAVSVVYDSSEKGARGNKKCKSLGGTLRCMYTMHFPENSRRLRTIVACRLISWAQGHCIHYTHSYSEHAHKLASQHRACCCFSSLFLHQQLVSEATFDLTVVLQAVPVFRRSAKMARGELFAYWLFHNF